MLTSVDLAKDPELIIASYSGPAMASTHMNVLTRMNRELVTRAAGWTVERQWTSNEQVALFALKAAPNVDDAALANKA